MQHLTLRALEATYQYHKGRYLEFITPYEDSTLKPSWRLLHLEAYLTSVRHRRPIYLRITRRYTWVLLGRHHNLYRGTDAIYAARYAGQIRKLYRLTQAHHRQFKKAIRD